MTFVPITAKNSASVLPSKIHVHCTMHTPAIVRWDVAILLCAVTTSIPRPGKLSFINYVM